MDTISKIKAEVERLIKKDNYETFDVPALLEFLDTLQEQEPQGLDEAAKNYANTTHFEWPNQVSAAKQGFKAGAEWMAEQVKTGDYIDGFTDGMGVNW